MTTTPLTLDTLRKEALHWRMDMSCDSFYYSFNGHNWEEISKESLDAIDTRLYPVLECLNGTDDWYSVGKLLHHTIMLWADAYIELSPRVGNYPYFIHRVINIEGIRGDNIQFASEVLESSQISNIPYIRERCTYYLSEPLTWLDEKYPDAASRLVAGMGVGLEREELIAYVFDRNPTPFKNIDMRGLDNLSSLEP